MATYVTSAGETIAQHGQGPSARWPRWIVELQRTLAVRPQFVISGNIRDVFLAPTQDGLVFLPIVPCLHEAFSQRGLSFLLVYDRVDGLKVFPETARAAAERLPNLKFDGRGAAQVSRETLVQTMRAVAGGRDTPSAMIIDYASRITSRPHDLSETELDFFVACEKLAHVTRPMRSLGQDGAPPYNPIIWLINRANDLPDWLVVGNEAIRTVVVGLPDRQTRFEAAAALARGFIDYDRLVPEQRTRFLDQFADLSDGLTLRSMLAVSQLARDQSIPLSGIADAVRLYKVGVPDNPWRQDYLKEKIRHGDRAIGQRVRGQYQAVRKALDILTRSAMGLSGAQASNRSGRPRGVLFFAGPTGVGKTELAKSITELLFGDEQSYLRFDMSEFSAEHSEARLLGSPPGYIGHDAGGELVNAVRQRPFSVLLFDEVEKAHPRILDKFLQILEDGRLTDGRGDTVFFSEAVIVFTSNLGIYVENDDGQRVLNVSPDEAPPDIERKIRNAIEHHFRFKLQRPELLNRIGDNIVVFDFIRREVASSIFEKMLANIIERVRDEHGVELEIASEVNTQILESCTASLDNGGRGIGNRLETVLINPLARALFENTPARGTVVTVSRITEQGGIASIELT